MGVPEHLPHLFIIYGEEKESVSINKLPGIVASRANRGRYRKVESRVEQEACNAKMSLLPTAVRPDRKWQPKLVRPANFGPLGALKLRTWGSHMADLLEPVVDCDSVKDVALLKDALKYIQTRHYPAGI